MMKTKEEYYDFYLKAHRREYIETQHRYDELLVEDISIYCDSDLYLAQMVDPPSEDQKEQLYKAIKQLTPKQQQIINLVIKGYKQQDIADQLGISQSAVSFALNGSNGHGGIYRRLKTILVGKQCIGCNKLIRKPRKKQRYCNKCRKYTPVKPA